jgi:hypothetical protein
MLWIRERGTDRYEVSETECREVVVAIERSEENEVGFWG